MMPSLTNACSISSDESNVYFTVDPCIGEVQLFVMQGLQFPTNESFDFKSDNPGLGTRQQVKTVLKYYNYRVGVFARPGTNFSIRASSFAPPEPVLDKKSVFLKQISKGHVEVKVYPPKVSSQQMRSETRTLSDLLIVALTLPPYLRFEFRMVYLLRSLIHYLPMSNRVLLMTSRTVWHMHQHAPQA